MNHPTREQWLAHLYADEAAPKEHEALQQHLAGCADCRARVESWRNVLGGLDRWTMEPRVVEPPRRASRWKEVAAVAAAIAGLLVVGFAVGRETAASKVEVAALRTRLAALSDGLDAKVRAAAAGEARRQWQPLSAALGDQLQDLRAEQAANYLSLRKELETVAVFTAASFRRTESSLVQLAGNSVPSNPPELR